MNVQEVINTRHGNLAAYFVVKFLDTLPHGEQTMASALANHKMTREQLGDRDLPALQPDFDWSGEVSSFPCDVAEMALAHTIENKVEATYRRCDLFEKRRLMMQSWSNYLNMPQVNVKILGFRKQS